MTEPVALPDLKMHLRLDSGATDEDNYLSSLIISARRACEKRLNLSVAGGALTLTLDDFPRRSGGWPGFRLEVAQPDELVIELPFGAVSSVDQIRYFDAQGTSQELSADQYFVDLDNIPGRIAPATAWPATAQRIGAVKISYTAGGLSDDDKAIVKQAMLLTIGQWYENREATSAEARSTPGELPLAVTWLLEPISKWATS